MLTRTAAIAAIAFAGYRYYRKGRQSRHAAFAAGQGDEANFVQVRDAGPMAMASDMDRWSKIDQRSDESFPASDPPATY